MLAELMTHPSKDIHTHLQEHVGDIPGNPVLDNGFFITAVKIHNAEIDTLACGWHAHELIAGVRGLQTAPARRTPCIFHHPPG